MSQKSTPTITYSQDTFYAMCYETSQWCKNVVVHVHVTNAYRELRYKTTHSKSRYYMKVHGQLRDPADLYPGMCPSPPPHTLRTEEPVRPRAGLDASKEVETLVPAGG